ncbi:MAG: efflux RND transporter periplasmic adaptor subunit, partial [Dehalococcoidia bacterium]|nr:efflux RND transporter periplasmic adaptor subunit [Dehalococcoidia bacterium]
MKGGECLMKRYCVTAGVVVMVVWLLLLSGCMTGGGSGQPRQTTTVRRGDLVSGVVAVGNLSLPRQMDLTFQLAGTVKEIKVKEGDAVKKGQVIALLDDTTLKDTVTERELALVQQEKALEAARLDLRRAAEQLEEIAPKSSNVYTYYTDIPSVQNNVALAQGSIRTALENLAAGKIDETRWALEEAIRYLHIAYSASSTTQFIPIERQKPVSDTIVTMRQYTYQYEKSQAAYDRAVFARDAAKLSLEQAKKQLEKAVLVAPYDGVISTVNVKEGANVGLNTVVCRLVDPSQVEMKGLVDEGDVNRLKIGMEAVVTLDAVPGVEVKGRLTFISPVATIQAGVVYYQVVVAVEPPRAFTLRDGMT